MKKQKKYPGMTKPEIIRSVRREVLICVNELLDFPEYLGYATSEELLSHTAREINAGVKIIKDMEKKSRKELKKTRKKMKRKYNNE